MYNQWNARQSSDSGTPPSRQTLDAGRLQQFAGAPGDAIYAHARHHHRGKHLPDEDIAACNGGRTQATAQDFRLLDEERNKHKNDSQNISLHCLRYGELSAQLT